MNIDSDPSARDSPRSHYLHQANIKLYNNLVANCTKTFVINTSDGCVQKSLWNGKNPDSVNRDLAETARTDRNETSDTSPWFFCFALFALFFGFLVSLWCGSPFFSPATSCANTIKPEYKSNIFVQSLSRFGTRACMIVCARSLRFFIIHDDL